MKGDIIVFEPQAKHNRVIKLDPGLFIRVIYIILYYIVATFFIQQQLRLCLKFVNLIPY